MKSVENSRNKLYYGKKQDTETIKEAIEMFNSLREIFRQVGVDYEE